MAEQVSDRLGPVLRQEDAIAFDVGRGIFPVAVAAALRLPFPGQADQRGHKLRGQGGLPDRDPFPYDFRVHFVAPAVPFFAVLRFGNHTLQQIRRGADAAASALGHTFPVHIPVQLVLVPDQRQLVQPRQERRDGAGVPVRHDGKPVQQPDRDRLKAGKLLRAEPFADLPQLFLGYVELRRLQLGQLEM